MAGRKGSKHVVVNITGQRKILRHSFIIANIGGKAVGHVFERKRRPNVHRDDCVKRTEDGRVQPAVSN